MTVWLFLSFRYRCALPIALCLCGAGPQTLGSAAGALFPSWRQTTLSPNPVVVPKAPADPGSIGVKDVSTRGRFTEQVRRNRQLRCCYTIDVVGEALCCARSYGSLLHAFMSCHRMFVFLAAVAGQLGYVTFLGFKMPFIENRHTSHLMEHCHCPAP